MKRFALMLGIALAASGPARAGEEVLYQSPPQPGVAASADPFAELLENYPSEIIKTGPSCSIVKIQLPPDVSPDEIAF